MSIDFELEDGVAFITINRPEKRNALDAEHYEGLSSAWSRVRDDKDVRVAVITGAGDKAFCAGADLKSWVGREQVLSDLWLTQKGQLLNRGLEVWKPVISAVNGYCIGGGMTLMLATDIRVASENATFGLAEVKRGIIAANGGTQRVMQQVPYCIGMEMLLTGDSIDAKTAARWGLINRVAPLENLREEALVYAHKISSNAPLAVQAAKELAVRSHEMTLAEGLRMEQMVNRILHNSEDTKEGKAAFAEKRNPDFQGE
jgi:E-phenylitaconyl-CoA hydratase